MLLSRTTGVIRSAALTSVAAMMFAVLVGTSARAQTGFQHITNAVSSLCLGVRGIDVHRPGAEVEVYRCFPGGSDEGLDNQWEFHYLRNGFVHIRNRVSAYCLGVRGIDSHSPGTGVEVYRCNPGGGDAGLDHQWRIVTQPNGFVLIQNRVSNLCLGVRGVDSHGPGTGAEVYHCDPVGADPGRDNRWRISRAVQKSALAPLRPAAPFPFEAKSWGGVVRSGPGNEFAQIGRLAERERITVIERADAAEHQNFPWFKVRFRGRIGYHWGGIICPVGGAFPGTFEVCR